MIYSLVKSNGSIKPIFSEQPLSLDQLQNLVGGYIEFAPVELGLEVCVNEEGILKNLPRNARYPQFFGDVVLGKTIAGENGDLFVGLL